MLDDYLTSRPADVLTVAEDTKQAVILLDHAGGQLDELWRRLQRATSEETTRRAIAEETNQTLAALSREIWEAHAAALTVLAAFAQLAEAEGRMAVTLKNRTAVALSDLQALEAARQQIKDLEAQLAALQVASPTPVPVTTT